MLDKITMNAKMYIKESGQVGETIGEEGGGGSRQGQAGNRAGVDLTRFSISFQGGQGRQETETQLGQRTHRRGTVESVYKRCMKGSFTSIWQPILKVYHTKSRPQDLKWMKKKECIVRSRL